MRVVIVHGRNVELLAESVMESLDLEKIAEEIRVAATDHAQKIMHRVGLPADFMRIEHDKDSAGPKIRIQVDEGGKISTYLSHKEEREQNWLTPAVEEVFARRTVI